MRVYQIRVAIFELDATGIMADVPVVVHLFHGKDRAAAQAVHQAHLKVDRFLAECENHGLFAGSVPCRSVLSEGWAKV